MRPADAAPALRPRTVRAVARCVLGEPEAELAGWRAVPIAGPLQPRTRVYRVWGAARAGGRERDWSAVLKVVPWPAAAEQAREAQVYLSGLLGGLPEGLRAPRLHRASRRPDGALWLWLEDVDERVGAWDVPRYGLAARHLGRLGARYAEGAGLGSARRYLSVGWLRGWIEANAPAIGVLVSRRSTDLVRLAYPPEVEEGIRRVWTGRERLLRGLERLPQTLCHFDAHRGNLIAADRPGLAETVLLDWQFAGLGPLGADAAPLVGATLTEGGLDVARAAALEESVLAGYLAGLAEGGWRGDERLARAGYAGVAGLRYTVGATRFLLPLLLEPEQGAAQAGALGTTLEALAAAMGGLFPRFLALAEEAEALLTALEAEGALGASR